MARKALSNAKLSAGPAKERSSGAKVSSKCYVIFRSPNYIGLQVIRCRQTNLLYIIYSCNFTRVSQDRLAVLSLSLCCAKSMFIFHRFYDSVLLKKSLRRCTCTWCGECTSASSVYMCVKCVSGVCVCVCQVCVCVCQVCVSSVRVKCACQVCVSSVSVSVSVSVGVSVSVSVSVCV